MKQKAKQSYVGQSVVVRADRAGIFVGILKSKDGNEIVLENARRIWYWDGAASTKKRAKRGRRNQW
jgi:hypothetical protein